MRGRTPLFMANIADMTLTELLGIITDLANRGNL